MTADAHATVRDPVTAGATLAALSGVEKVRFHGFAERPFQLRRDAVFCQALFVHLLK